MRKVFHGIYGIAMIIIFIVMCAFAEGGRFEVAFPLAMVGAILAIFYDKIFPAKDKNEKKEDAV